MESNIRKPKCVNLQGNKKFLTVSYCHADKEIVFRELCALEDQNATFWYDDRNLIGDDWLINFKNSIDSDLCVGAIVFISENTFLNSNVYKELQYIDLISEPRKLIFLPILIDNKNTLGKIDLNNLYAESLKKICNISDMTKINEIAIFSIEILNLLNKMLHKKNVLFGRTCQNLNCNNTTENICANNVDYPCQYRKNVIEKLDFLKALSTYSYSTKDLENEALANKLIVNGTYRSVRVKWINISKEKDIFTFVCNKVLETSLKEETDEILNKIKNYIKIDKYGIEWELVSNNPIRLLTENEYLQVKSKLKKYVINSNNNQNVNMADDTDDINYELHEEDFKYINYYWWINTDDDNKNFVLADGNIASHILYDNEKLGIRPVIVLKHLVEE